jgi:hypothetical protein
VRLVLSLTIAVAALSVGLFLESGAKREHASALGTPSTLPFHQRILIVSRDGFDGVAASDLRAAEARWARNGSLDYRITVSWGGFGSRESHTLYVHDGIVGDYQSECFSGPERVECGAVDYSNYTVPGIFALLRRKVAEQGPNEGEAIGAPFVRGHYHPELGYPVQFSFGLRSVPDATTYWQIEDLQLIY